MRRQVGKPTHQDWRGYRVKPLGTWQNLCNFDDTVRHRPTTSLTFELWRCVHLSLCSRILPFGGWPSKRRIAGNLDILGFLIGRLISFEGILIANKLIHFKIDIRVRGVLRCSRNYAMNRLMARELSHWNHRGDCDFSLETLDRLI